MRIDADFRLAIVLSHPTQYYSPWFKWLQKESGLRFKVFYLWNFGVVESRDPQFLKSFSWDVDLISGYESELVANESKLPGTEHFGGLKNPSLFGKLKAYGPSAILLFGYKYWTHLNLIKWARFRSIPLIFRGDSHFLGRKDIALLKNLLLSLLYRQFSTITYVGKANKSYFTKLGVSSNKLFFAPHSVNHSLFRRCISTSDEAIRIRKELGIDDKRVILFAGKFTPNKQPCELLNAFLRVADPRLHALLFVGDGPLKDQIKAIASYNSTFKIIVLPFANQSEMPLRYLMADIFALPSRGFYETWGLAVNEAMHMGLPCLVSDLVGCQQDLVIDGETGWVFDASSSESLSRKIFLSLTTSLDEFEPKVLARIKHYEYDSTTRGLLAAISGIEKA